MLWLMPLLGVVGALGAAWLVRKGKTLASFVASSLACAGVIFTTGIAMLPFVMPSSSNPNHSLTAWDVASSAYTLNVMLWVALIFTPIVLAYTAWGYRVMRGKLTEDYIAANDKMLY
ncbi:MAG: cytochrome d ubiquinol oxidase subunit II [Casimicrobiaceae bacterium]|nr:cytochrome d ubiquinol oxidase subunit II [Casimicrobiaceae bacterium]